MLVNYQYVVDELDKDTTDYGEKLLYKFRYEYVSQKIPVSKESKTQLKFSSNDIIVKLTCHKTESHFFITS